MGSDDAITNRQAKTSPATRRFCCIEWVKDMRKVLGRDARTVVGKLDRNRVHLRIISRLNKQVSAPGHCVPGIQKEIQKHLLNLIGISFYKWNVSIDRTLDFQSAKSFVEIRQSNARV